MGTSTAEWPKLMRNQAGSQSSRMPRRAGEAPACWPKRAPSGDTGLQVLLLWTDGQRLEDKPSLRDKLLGAPGPPDAPVGPRPPAPGLAVQGGGTWPWGPEGCRHRGWAGLGPLGARLGLQGTLGPAGPPWPGGAAGSAPKVHRVPAWGAEGPDLLPSTPRPPCQRPRAAGGPGRLTAPPCPQMPSNSLIGDAGGRGTPRQSVSILQGGPVALLFPALGAAVTLGATLGPAWPMRKLPSLPGQHHLCISMP